MSSAEALWRIAGATAAAVGLTAALTPRLLARVVGLPVQGMTSTAVLGWRFFGIRTALIGGAALAGDRPARLIILPVQVPDQLAMIGVWRSGTVPRKAVVTAMGISWGLVAATVSALRSESEARGIVVREGLAVYR